PETKEIRVLLSRILLVNVLLIMPSVSVHADKIDQHFIPEWTETCSANDVPFSVTFHSKSGQPDNDDLEVKALLPNNKELKILLSEALYVRRGMVSAVKNVCDNIGAIRLPQNRVLLLISSDSRPGWDRLNLVYLDVGKGKVLDLKEQVGEMKDL